MKTRYEARTLKVCALHNPGQNDLDRGPPEAFGNGGYDARLTVAEVIAREEGEGWIFKCCVSRSDALGLLDLHFIRAAPE